MNDDDLSQMNKFNITYTTEPRYHYKGHKYSKLSDAVRFAKIDTLQNTGKQEPYITSARKTMA